MHFLPNIEEDLSIFFCGGRCPSPPLVYPVDARGRMQKINLKKKVENQIQIYHTAYAEASLLAGCRTRQRTVANRRRLIVGISTSRAKNIRVVCILCVSFDTAR